MDSLTLTRQVSASEFFAQEQESMIHGRSHIHRVMVWADKIATSMGFHDLRGDIIAAARIHDLARDGDGVCFLHGQKAAELIPEYESFLKETFGMKNPEAVAYACRVHCLPKPLDPDHPHFRVAAVLKDADALDRFRLGGDEGPDPARMNFERSLFFAKAAKELARQTMANHTPLDTIQRIANQLSNPAKDARLSCPISVPLPNETSRELRNRRLRQGTFAEEMKRTVDALENSQVVTEAAKMGVNLPPDERTKIITQMRWASEFFNGFRAVTYFPAEGFQKFKEDGITKDLWETGPTWHTKYVATEEDALDARAYNDERLWGERGTPITYGVLLPPGEAGTELDTQLKKMYGEHSIEWDFAKIMEYSSFSVNDSQEAKFCLPCDVFKETLIRQIVQSLGRHFEWAYMLNQKCPFPESIMPQTVFRFIEIQIHRAMRLEDVKT